MTTDAVATAGLERGPTETTTVTRTGTGTGIGTLGTGEGIVMVSAATMKETEPKIDVAIEIVSGTGTETATGTTGTIGNAAGNAETRAKTATREPRGSGPTKVLRNRLFRPHRHPQACPRLRLPLLIAHVVETALGSLEAGMATGRLGVLGTLVTTLRNPLDTGESESAAVRPALPESTCILSGTCQLVLKQHTGVHRRLTKHPRTIP